MNGFLAEGERLELSRHLAMTYRFSKPAPSPTWVTLHIKKWSWRQESNLQPADYKSAALPIVLRQHMYKALVYVISIPKADICK